MLSLFRHKRQRPPPPPSVSVSVSVAEGYLPIESAHSLLAAEHRRQLLDRIWQSTALSHSQFIQLYLNPIHRYAEQVQQLPASETHHHAYLGGMLDHGLELVACSLKLRQSYLLPTGAAPEDQAAQTDAWSAGIAYGALLHDIGKIAVDLLVERQDGRVWHPWQGPLDQPYRFRYLKGRDYHLHGAAAGLLYTQILDRPILDWLSGFPPLWASLLYVLAGQYERAGMLGELVIQADRVSTAQNIGGKPQAIRSDNGPEFISAKLAAWAEKRGIRLDFIQPGNPQQNAYVERYNRTVRYDWLGHYLFESITEVQDYGTNWIWTYNHERPNMALGGITPKQKLVENCTPLDHPVALPLTSQLHLS